MNDPSDSLLGVFALYLIAVPFIITLYFFIKSKKKKTLTIIEKLDREIEKHSFDYNKKLAAYKTYDKLIIRNKEEFFNFYDLISSLERSIYILEKKTIEIKKNIDFINKFGSKKDKANQNIFEKDYDSILDNRASVQNNINIDKEMLFNNFKEL